MIRYVEEPCEPCFARCSGATAPIFSVSNSFVQAEVQAHLILYDA